MKLIPNWRQSWRLHSAQVFAVAAFIATVRTAAQHLTDDPGWDWLTHAEWFAPTMAGLGVVGYFVRLIPQPSVSTPQPPEGNIMNLNLQALLKAIPNLVISAEAAFKGTGSGAEKAAAVTGIVAAALPADSSDGMAKAQAVMEMAVAFFNAVHPMFQKAPVGTTIEQAYGQKMS